MVGVIERILDCTLSGDLIHDLEDGVVFHFELASRTDSLQTLQETRSRQGDSGPSRVGS